MKKKATTSGKPRTKEDSGSIPEGKRVTLADVGHYCGYHGTTVGLALRNHPGIPEETRLKIRAAADALGYVPDPAMRALVAHRHGLSKGKGYSTIAVISDRSKADGWRSARDVGHEYYTGMCRRAKELGYKLEEYSIGQDHGLQHRVDQILNARGISTVIVAPQANLDSPLDFKWEAYSAVALGYSLISPPLPRVTHQHRDGTQRSVLELMKLGYRRIAFLNPYEYEVRVGYGYSAGFFGTVNLHSDVVSSCSLVPKDNSNLARPETVDWLKKNRPQAVISSQAHLLDFLRSNGVRIPEEMGYVRLGVEIEKDPKEQVSGIYENSPLIGMEAVDLVARMQAIHLRGVPSVRQVHLVQGKWIPGTTVKRVGESLI